MTFHALTDTQEHANQIAKAVTLEYQSQGKPILTLEDAVRSNSFFTNPSTDVTKVGDVTCELCLSVSGQAMHVYRISPPPILTSKSC